MVELVSQISWSLGRIPSFQSYVVVRIEIRIWGGDQLVFNMHFDDVSIMLFFMLKLSFEVADVNLKLLM